MNFGTDLNAAYAGDNNTFQNQYTMPEKSIQEPIQISNPVQQNISHQQQTPLYVNESSNIPGVTMEDQVKFLKNELLKVKEKKNQTSVISKFISKKKEMFKIFILSLVILLALSSHCFLKHYLKLYILDNDLESRKELLFRFAYPLTIFLFIWITKAFKSSD